jgi:hypothetical protein
VDRSAVKAGNGEVAAVVFTVGNALGDALVLWMPKTSAIWADSRETLPLGPAPGGRRTRSVPGCACDDLRLVGLKLIFLIVTRAVSLLGLSRREGCGGKTPRS